jgi:hypothetical protein
MKHPAKKHPAKKRKNPDQEKLADALLEAAGTLQFFAVQILSSSLAGSFENTFAGPAVYAAEHARRLASVLRDDPTRDIDLVAWSARCLYETRMALFHLLSHPKPEAEALLKQWVDHGDVLVAKTITDLYSDSESEKQVLQAELKKFGRPKLPKEMAELTGCLDEHRRMYGLLCLYTHPTKWLLFGAPTIARNPELAGVFCRRALYYLNEIHEAIAYVLDYIGEAEIDESQREHAIQTVPNPLPADPRVAHPPRMK